LENDPQLQDVVCLDKTRVVLKQDVPPLTDYIHANWVRFDKHDREFIATQCMEDDKIKCSAYWPTEAGKFFTQGKIFVNTKKVESEEKFMIYTIELVPEGCSNSHVVKMIHMTNWPDRGVPQSGRHVLRLLRKVVMVEIFKKLRDQRAQSIPVDVLYIFVVVSVIDYIRAKLPGKYKEKTQRFMDEYKTLQSQHQWSQPQQ
ncbi:Protein-tyrosine phosphatase, partial [Ancylostoma ceylanicum]